MDQGARIAKQFNGKFVSWSQVDEESMYDTDSAYFTVQYWIEDCIEKDEWDLHNEYEAEGEGEDQPTSLEEQNDDRAE